MFSPVILVEFSAWNAVSELSAAATLTVREVEVGGLLLLVEQPATGLPVCPEQDDLASHVVFAGYPVHFTAQVSVPESHGFH